VNPPALRADKPDAAAATQATRKPPEAAGVAKKAEAAPELLKDPMPRILTILVSPERRYATVDGGQILGVGDIVGRRTVVAIDERAVVLREPSGVQIRVGLGGRILGVAPADR
jgi:hypothetical protein